MADFKVEGPEIKKLLAVAKTKPIPFAFNPGADVKDHYLGMDRKKPATVLGKAALADGPSKKFAFGTATLEGKLLTLTCERTVPSMARKLKQYLKLNKVQVNIQILDLDGEPIEADITDDVPDDPEMEQAVADPAPNDEEDDAGNEEITAADLGLDEADLKRRLTELRDRIMETPDPIRKKLGAHFKTVAKAMQDKEFQRVDTGIDKLHMVLEKLMGLPTAPRPPSDEKMAKILTTARTLSERSEGIKDAKVKLEIKQHLGRVSAAAEQDEEGDAMNALKAAQELLASAEKAQNAAQKRWQAAAEKVAHAVKEALDKNTAADPDALRKSWETASGHAKDGAFDLAVAELPAVVNLLKAARKPADPKLIGAMSKTLAALMKTVTGGALSREEAAGYQKQIAAIARELQSVKAEGSDKDAERMARQVSALKLELTAKTATDPDERRAAQEALDAQQTENVKKDQEKGLEILQEEQDAAGLEYTKAYKEQMPRITEVVTDKDLAVIGGGAVRGQLNKALALAAKKKWKEATYELGVAFGNAEIAVLRKPFIQARRKYEADIKAAFDIKEFPDPGPSYGAQLKELWDQAHKLADGGETKKSAAVLEQAGKLVQQIKDDPALKQKKKELREARDKNINAMRDLLKESPVDIKKLKEYAANELKGFAKDAAKLGDDSAAPTREPCSDWAGAEKIFKQYDWFALKDKLHDHSDKLIDKERMWDLWRYRQKYVTDLIDKIRARYPTLIAKASGSADMESDIDITFASPELGKDVEAAQEFNETIIKTFGKPAGRTFDVNIYPRDYSAISESFNEDFTIDHIQDKAIDEPTGDMGQLSQVDQDVATLLKQRRFLDTDSFQALYKQVLGAIKDEDTRKKVQLQYENGEQIYLRTADEKIGAILAKVIKNSKGKEEEDLTKEQKEKAEKALKLHARYEELQKSSGVKNLEEMQRLIPDLLDALEAAFEDDVMEATDEIYLNKMADLRKKQVKIEALDNAQAGPKDHHPEGDCAAVHPDEPDHEKWRVRHAEALKAQVKNEQFTNIIFANEAYMSQGAIEHVVAGIQASKKSPEAAKEIIGKLTPATIMQSINEQMADFFKDMKSSEAALQGKSREKQREVTGEAFVHASKYLTRLLDGAKLLVDKYADMGKELKFDLFEKVVTTRDLKSPEALKAKVDEMLYALRKSSEIPADVKAELGIDEVKTVFGVEDIAGFRKVISDFCIEVNAKIRESEAFMASQKVNPDTEKQYFAQHEGSPGE